MTTNPVKLYKRFVDGLCQFKGSVNYITEAFATRQWSNPASVSLHHLDDESRQAVLQLMHKAARAAVHDVLVYLNDADYKLTKEGCPLAIRPFDMAIYEDWASRSQGIPWPDEED